MPEKADSLEGAQAWGEKCKDYTNQNRDIPYEYSSGPMQHFVEEVRSMGNSVRELVEDRQARRNPSNADCLSVDKLLPLIEPFSKNDYGDNGKDWQTWKSDIIDQQTFNRLTDNQVGRCMGLDGCSFYTAYAQCNLGI